MNSRKLSRVLIGVSASIVLMVSAVFSTDQQRHLGRSVVVPSERQLADGSGPVPPLPPPNPIPPRASVFVGDGSGPVPPLPPPHPGLFLADGSGPVPPLPPPPPNPSGGGFFAV